ncbi:MAG: carboxypeptidase M32 [Planctomycetota bacterium]
MIRDLYDKLLVRLLELADLGAVASLLEWDQETNMPPKGAAARGSQRGVLAGILHERFVSPELRELVESLRARLPELEPDQQVVVRETARDQDRAIKVPTDLVKAIAKLESESLHAWGEARKEGTFSTFAPFLERLLALKRQVAEAIGYEETAYDALLETYEHDMRCSILVPLFAELRQRLVPLVQRIVERGPVEPRFIVGTFPTEHQRQLGQRVAEAMGFDFEAGRLDRSVHPFCQGLHPTDVRLTWRYDESDLRPALFGLIHEAGHGLYEQGLDAPHWGTPLCAATSFGMHESQSRLWENIVGRSRAFWRFFLPVAKEVFPASLSGCTLDSIYREVNVVRPSLIRVEADEVTYNLHIILRYELERALFSGDLEVADLPAAFNERMEQDLGVRPPDDTQGCLQDIHWAMGLFGYFPTYTLGNLFAAILWKQACRDITGLEDSIAAGHLLVLRDWLREKVHRQGRRYSAAELIERVAGHAPGVDDFASYLEGKFVPLYRL